MQKHLYRSRTDRVLAGVAGGIGRYFNLDSVFVRIFFVAAAFGGGAGVWIYIVLWLILPEEPATLESSTTPALAEAATPGPVVATTDPAAVDRRNTIVGILLLTLGAVFLVHNYIPEFDFSDFWPIVLIAVGCAVLWNGTKRS